MPFFLHIDQTGMYYGRHNKNMIAAFLQPMKGIGADKVNAAFGYDIDAIWQVMLYFPIYSVNSLKKPIGHISRRYIVLAIDQIDHRIK